MQDLVLIVEDHETNQRVAQLYLRQLGLQSHIVSNGQEALEAIRTTRYAVILMDWQMPVMDGVSATKEIRKSESYTGGHVPIIAVTAFAREGDRESCLAAGMDDYLSKPLELANLKKALEKWIDFSTICAEPIDLISLHTKFKQQADMLVETFIEDASQEIEKLDQCVESQCSPEFLFCAHGLIGLCGTVNAFKMQQICRDLETAGKEKSDWTAKAELVKALKSEFARLKDYVSEAKIL